MKKIYSGVVFIGLLGALSACSAQVSEEQAAQLAPIVTQEAVAQETVRLDEREILPLNQMQREFVLAEMRGLLVATQGVIEGLALEDMQMVQEAAAAAGMEAQGTVENKQNMQRLRMGQVLPPEFGQMGQATHIAFGEITKMAADGKPAKDIQLKLVDTMHACVACHSAYQIPNP